MFMDGMSYYTDGVPSEEILEKFASRKDRQITTLEILASSVGLSTFQELLRGRKVVVWTDNKGAEGAARGGRAKAWDHCRLIHEMWPRICGLSGCLRTTTYLTHLHGK